RPRHDAAVRRRHNRRHELESVRRRAMLTRRELFAVRPHFAPPESGREVMRKRYFPNVPLITHEGKRVRFYDDLLKGRIVLLNLMYADCTASCPLITAN